MGFYRVFSTRSEIKTHDDVLRFDKTTREMSQIQSFQKRHASDYDKAFFQKLSDGQKRKFGENPRDASVWIMVHYVKTFLEEEKNLKSSGLNK